MKRNYTQHKVTGACSRCSLHGVVTVVVVHFLTEAANEAGTGEKIRVHFVVT